MSLSEFMLIRSLLGAKWEKMNKVSISPLIVLFLLPLSIPPSDKTELDSSLLIVVQHEALSVSALMRGESDTFGSLPPACVTAVY